MEPRKVTAACQSSLVRATMDPLPLSGPELAFGGFEDESDR
jgi:hypothetical protein